MNGDPRSDDGDGEDDPYLEWDGVARDALPEHLARAAKDGAGELALLGEGILFTGEDGISYAPWRDVFGVTLHEREAYVMVPREPPRPPWFRVHARELGAYDDPEAFASMVRSRSQQHGYRIARARREPLSAKDLRDRVMRREEVGGLLEIPPGFARPDPAPFETFVLRTAGAAVLGYIGALVFLTMASATYFSNMDPDAFADGSYSDWLCTWSLLGVPAAVGLMVWARRQKKRARRNESTQRVMVLAPDGCVIGFPHPVGPKAFSWDELERFSLERKKKGKGTPKWVDVEELVIRDASDEELGRLDERFFGAPMELVVAVANTYRARALAS